MPLELWRSISIPQRQRIRGPESRGRVHRPRSQSRTSWTISPSDSWMWRMTTPLIQRISDSMTGTVSDMQRCLVSRIRIDFLSSTTGISGPPWIPLPGAIWGRCLRQPPAMALAERRPHLCTQKAQLGVHATSLPDTGHHISMSPHNRSADQLPSLIQGWRDVHFPVTHPWCAVSVSRLTDRGSAEAIHHSFLFHESILQDCG